MARLLFALLCSIAVAVPLGGQSTSRLGANARLRVWSQTFALRGAEARLIDRWADTLIVSIEHPHATEPLRDVLQLSTSQIDSLEYWASTARERRTLRNRYLVVGGIGLAIIAGAAGGVFSVGEAMLSAAFVTLFVAAGSSDTPQGAWRAVELRPPASTPALPTAPAPGVPDR